MKLTKEQLIIKGMHCSGCADRVSTVLNELQGVRSAEVSLDEEQAVVEFDSNKTGFDRMKEAIEKAGYNIERQ